MTREDLEHLICAAATISDEDEIVVIGSQAVLASFPNAPPEMLLSMEADMYPRHDPARAELFAGVLGEGSPFHDMNGYYAEAVGRERRAVGWCLEIHDLVAAKCAARRDRDWQYAKAAVANALVERDVLWQRAQTLPLAQAHLEYVLHVLGGVLGRR